MMDWIDMGFVEEVESIRVIVLVTKEVNRREEELLSSGTWYYLW